MNKVLKKGGDVMTDAYSVKRRIKRFSEKISVIEKDGISIQLAENEIYNRAYNKLFDMIEKNNVNDLSVTVAYLDKEAISFLCRFGKRVVPLNYFIETGFFERDSRVIKKRGIDRREIKRALKNIKDCTPMNSPCVFLVSGGVGVLLAPNGEKCVKIRRK